MSAEFAAAVAAIVPPSLEPTAAIGSLASSTAAAGPASAGFGELVSNGLDQVNRQLVDGEVSLQRLATGESTNLHQVMIQMEESRLSFQLMMQVRGRLLEAYQDVMRMQV